MDPSSPPVRVLVVADGTLEARLAGRFGDRDRLDLRFVPAPGAAPPDTPDADAADPDARVSGGRSSSTAVDDGPADCVVAADVPGVSPAHLRSRYGDVPVVVLQTDPATDAASLLDAGAADVVPVPESNPFERLPDRIESVVAWRRRRSVAEDRITERLKERAMDEAPVGITIADNSLPDRPLVYVNDAFVTTTGYSEATALGRNCRYLQGPGTDPEPVAELRRAVEAGERTSVVLLNYRRDGSRFWNRVDLAPIADDGGEVTHFVGFQTDITDRVRAEEAAERFAAVADRERAHLRRLLDRVEGLLHDGTRTLVQAETRTALERGVLERVAATDAVRCAWVGDCDRSPDAVVPKEWAGERPPDAVDLRVDRDDPSDPVARAVATLSPAAAADSEGRFHAGAAVPFEGVVAVPFVHRETLYGVMVVYGDASVTDDYEQVVLGTLGRAVGAAIDAFESRRSLLTETRLEVRLAVSDPDSPLVSLAAAGDCDLDYEGVVAREDGSVLLFVSASPPGAPLETIDVPGVERVRAVRSDADGGLYEVALAPGTLLGVIPRVGGRLTGLSVDAADRTLELATAVPDRSTGRALVEEVESIARGVTLSAVREREGPRTTGREFVAGVERELTDKQRTALQLAYLGGYFEQPRRVTGDDLAAAMDVSRATFHQHLRVAERKLLSQFFGDDPN
jgi:PAS domain S-box-containing protein